MFKKNTKRRVLDRTTAKIGETITIGDAYGGEHFKVGDKLEVIGFDFCENGISSGIFEGQFFHEEEYVCETEYLVNLFTPTGEKKRYQIAVYETEEGGKKYNCFTPERVSPNKELKRLINILRTSGANDFADAFQSIRTDHALDRLKDRKELNKERRERHAAETEAKFKGMVSEERLKSNSFLRVVGE